jgi:ABC-type antimicrobial peptide transport system permease subunit
MLRKNPGFTTVAVITLALGIGAATAIFSVVYGVLLRPLPYLQADRLVALHEVNDHGGLMNFADPNFGDVRASSRALDGVAEYAAWMQSVAGASEPTRTMVARVSRDFFPLLRLQPVLGRAFAPEDQRFGAAPVALVSYAYWQQYLGSAADLSRVRLTIEDQAVSVVGVLPPGFRFPTESDVWEPRELSQPLPSRTGHNWHVLARLRDGATLAQARSELTGISRRLKQQYGKDTMMVDVSTMRLQDWLTNEVRKPLYLLLAAVGFLLLVACANVANLLLAHVAARERELAIRVALGAGRTRLVLQFLTEVLLVTLSAGGLGVLTAQWGVDALLGLAPSNLLQATDVSVNLPVLLFALAVAVGVALSLGFVAAWRAASGDPDRALAERGQGYVATTHSQRLGGAIVAGQLAITLVLLVGAGLLGRSLLRVLSVDPGFRTDHILTVDLALPPAFEDQDKAPRAQFLNELVKQLRALPGVQEAGGTAHLPLTAHLSDGTFLVMRPEEGLSRAIAGLQGASPQERTARVIQELDALFRGVDWREDDADYCPTDGGYFRALGIPLRRGRLFDERDTFDSPPVALISESLARRKWPHEDPLGQTIEFGNMDGDLRLLTVVGVVGDVRQDNLETAPPETIYVNYRQRPQATYQFTVVMRTSVPPAALIPAARKIVRDLAPDVPPSFSTFSKVFSDSLKARRFNLLLVGVFAATALLLALAGVYGVMAYSVARRTHEIGVRMALGAEITDVLGLVLRQGLVTAGVGIVVGVLASFELTHAVASLLFGVSSTDPVTFAGVAAMLLLAALMACYIPARRATKVDPMVALRYE